MANIITINNVIDILKDISSRHYILKGGFYLGKNWDIENDGDINYPVLQVYLERGRMLNTDGEYKTIQIDVNCKVIDSTQQSEADEKDVHSDTFQICQDIVRELSQHPYYQRSNAKIINDIDLLAIEEYNDDYGAGHEFVLTFQLIMNQAFCGDPIANLPNYSYNGAVSTGYSYNAQYMPIAGGVFTGAITGTCGYFNCLNAINISGTSLSGQNIYLSGVSLTDTFLTINAAISSATTIVQNGINTFTGGTFLYPTVNITAATLDNLTVTNQTLFNGNINLIQDKYFYLNNSAGFYNSSIISTPNNIIFFTNSAFTNSFLLLADGQNSWNDTTSSGRITLQSGISTLILDTLDESVTIYAGTGNTNFNSNVKINGSLTANTISATTYYNLPTLGGISITGTSFTNNILSLNNSTGGTLTQLIDNFSGLTVNGSLSANTISATTYLNLPTYTLRTFMFANANSDISGYTQMVALGTYISATTGTKSASVTTTPTLIATFATNIGFPNMTILPIGVVNIHYKTQKSAGSNNYYTYVELYKRTSGGSETLISTSDNSTPISINTIQEIDIQALITSNINLDITDRIIIKIYGVMLTSSATITVSYDDSTSARLELPATLVDISNFVPYQGAGQNVNLGNYNLNASTIIANKISATTITATTLQSNIISGTSITGRTSVFAGNSIGQSGGYIINGNAALEQAPTGYNTLALVIGGGGFTTAHIHKQLFGIGLSGTPSSGFITKTLQVGQPSLGFGTLTTTSGSTNVVGSSTYFLNSFNDGDTINIAGNYYAIASVNSDTGLTLSRTASTNSTNVAYSMTGGTKFFIEGQGSISSRSNSVTGFTIWNSSANTQVFTVDTRNRLVTTKSIEVNNRIWNTLTPTTGSTAITIDWSLNNLFDYTLTTATTFTFSNVQAGQTLIVGVRQNNTNAYTYSFSGSTVKWQGGTTPTITTTTGKTDIYTFVTLSGGTVYGSVLTNF